jgi:Mrp family chromosome partitioning ATPase
LPFLTHKPLIAQPVSMVRAALLGLTLCLLLLAAPPIGAAQPRTHGGDPPFATKYHAITHQPGYMSPTRMLQGLGLVLTIGLGALFVRFVRNETAAARQAELEGWAVPNHLTGAAKNIQLRAAAGGLELDDDRFDVQVSGDALELEREATASELYEDSESAPAEVLPRYSSTPAADGTSHRRLIYHVGPYRFCADREVLGPLAHTHLEDLCDALCSPDNTRRIVRVASGLNSRYAKSQVAAELAQMLADRPDVRVLALEGDLDAPALHRALHVNVPRGHGLSEQLQRMAELESVDTASALQLSPSLHALVENRWSTPAALGLPQFSQLLSRQRDVYDFIIIDGPVVDSWPDAEHFGGLIDGVVFVTLASTRLPDTLTLVGQHFAHDLLLRIVKTGEPSGS